MYAQFFIYRRSRVLSLEIKQSLVRSPEPARRNLTLSDTKPADSKVFPLADSILRRPLESGSG